MAGVVHPEVAVVTGAQTGGARESDMVADSVATTQENGKQC